MDLKSMLFFLTAITVLAGFSEWMNPTTVTARQAVTIKYVAQSSANLDVKGFAESVYDYTSPADYSSYEVSDYGPEPGVCAKHDATNPILALPTPARILKQACVLKWENESK